MKIGSRHITKGTSQSYLALVRKCQPKPIGLSLLKQARHLLRHDVIGHSLWLLEADVQFGLHGDEWVMMKACTNGSHWIGQGDTRLAIECLDDAIRDLTPKVLTLAEKRAANPLTLTPREKIRKIGKDVA